VGRGGGARRGVFREPGVARGGAAIGAGDAAGVEEANAGDDFVSRNVGVAVEDDLGAGGRLGRRNVGEMQAKAFALEVERPRPVGAIVAVAADDAERRAGGRDGREDGGVGHVAEVPDLIGAADPPEEGGWEAVVSIGEDGDAHARPSSKNEAAASG